MVYFRTHVDAHQHTLAPVVGTGITATLIAAEMVPRA